mmetsp:Transcript_13353/g.31289  ORF Transcript_13353/g.31289 Transcript_13353/m.31289 type:complete len:486 (+) Transcript_13353:197-1654(+)|eukprot:CAMPEP_0177713828 /NCGR_PEP_ID=MMETSP0484_2-20121128/13142_1 /TAXON_ID=354590 /ORGANISM="Rhodomonas lens, Strain RHODO" /LENGTH=485 /DNA_ID=CAMNT_0019225733 /DNA_START=155 /DNA_END=1612 /DNA_ORIENTATION=+
MRKRAIFALLCLGIPFVAPQNFCCKKISWSGDWCHRGDCQGYGCQIGEPDNVCSEISDCICAKDVWYKTKAFCTVLKSCAKAKEDYEFARQMVLLYTGALGDEACVAAIESVVCSYHFPVCLSDQEDFQMICYDTCLELKESCNITLPYFASVGDRCHFEKIWKADSTQISERAVIDGNKECTAAGSRTLAGCFSSSATVYKAVNETEARGLARTPISALEIGDRIASLSAEGAPISSKVIFLHTHRHLASTLRLYLDHSSDFLELTPSHLLPLATAPDGRPMSASALSHDRHNTSLFPSSPAGHGPASSSSSSLPFVLLPAGEIAVGAVLWAQALPSRPGECTRVSGIPARDSAGAKLEWSRPGARRGEAGVTRVVTRVEKACGEVRYVVTDAESDLMLVNSVWAAAYSTRAGALETVPFRFLDAIAPGVLAWGPVRAALHAVLESPALAHAERVVVDLVHKWTQAKVVVALFLKWGPSVSSHP